MQHLTEGGIDRQSPQETMRNDDMLRQPAQWYVAYTEARKEAVALINLERQRFHVYLPLYKTRKKQASGATPAPIEAFEPMFPRYMFFRPSSQRQSLSTVRSTRGVISVLRFGSEFALVPQEVISSIQEHEERRRNTDLSPGATLRPGTHVRISEPALNGLEGLVHSVSSQRIIVLMEILGKQTRVKVSRDAIEAA